MKSNYLWGVVITSVILGWGFTFALQYTHQNIFPNWIPVKLAWLEARGRRIEGPKIIIVGGSNGQFGINSEQLAEITGWDVLNLSTHGALDLSFHRSILEKNISEGDVVLLPLELGYYTKEKLTSVHTEYMSKWGLSYLDFSARLEFLKAVSFGDFFQGRLTYYQTNGIAMRDIEIRLADSTLSKNRDRGFYHWDQLTLTGEFIYKDPPSGQALNKDFEYYGGAPLSNHFLTQIEKIYRIVEARNGRVILTYPATMRNPLFNLALENHRNRMYKLQQHLAGHSIALACNPALFHVDRRFFLNTKYHLNADGVEIRTENLGRCINGVLGNAIQNDDISLVYAEVTQQQLRYRTIASTYTSTEDPEGASIIKRMVSDILRLQKALKAYKQKYRKFPSSSGFDGLYTKWGKSSVNWIPGLSPEFMKQLPRDPRASDLPGQQYLYKSDGVDFKLIVHGVDTGKNPLKEYVDPKRPTWAAGIWTPGAKNW